MENWNSHKSQIKNVKQAGVGKESNLFFWSCDYRCIVQENFRPVAQPDMTKLNRMPGRPDITLN